MSRGRRVGLSFWSTGWCGHLTALLKPGAPPLTQPTKADRWPTPTPCAPTSHQRLPQQPLSPCPRAHGRRCEPSRDCTPWARSAGKAKPASFSGTVRRPHTHAGLRGTAVSRALPPDRFSVPRVLASLTALPPLKGRRPTSAHSPAPHQSERPPRAGLKFSP